MILNIVVHGNESFYFIRVMCIRIYFCNYDIIIIRGIISLLVELFRAYNDNILIATNRYKNLYLI